MILQQSKPTDNKAFFQEELSSHIKEIMALAESSNVLSAISMTEDIYEAICNIAIRNFEGLRMVWLGLIEKEGFKVKPVAQAGFEEGYLSSINITWDDSPTGMGPTGMAIKTMSPKVMHYMDTDPAYAPWKDEALKRGYCSSMAVPLFNSDADVIGVINFYSDKPQFFIERRMRLFNVFANYVSVAIENRWLIKRLEENVKERTKKLEEARIIAEAANRAKSEFISNMSHELRTPLNAIIGFSEIMLDDEAGNINEEQRREYLREIINSGKELLSTIDEIIEVSKMESGDTVLEPSETDIRDLLNSTVAMFKDKIFRHGFKVHVQIDDKIESVVVDAMKIKEVIINFLSNAIKFTPDGGTISVRAHYVEGGSIPALKPEGQPQGLPQDFIEISVEDTGIGISEADMPRLFQPFQQLESPLRKKYRGRGLGLYLCKRYTEFHGGKIWAESEQGKGSRFVFMVPMK